MWFVLQVSGYSFRSAVRELIPQLIFLDDVPAEEDKPQRCRASLQDWTLLRDSIKDASVSDGQELAGKDKQQLLKTLSAALHVFKNQSLHQKRALSDLLQPGPRVSPAVQTAPDLSPPAPDQDQDPPAPTSPSWTTRPVIWPTVKLLKLLFIFTTRYSDSELREPQI